MAFKLFDNKDEKLPLAGGVLFFLVSLPQLYKATNGINGADASLIEPNITWKSALLHAIIFAVLIYVIQRAQANKKLL